MCCGACGLAGEAKGSNAALLFAGALFEGPANGSKAADGAEAEGDGANGSNALPAGAAGEGETVIEVRESPNKSKSLLPPENDAFLCAERSKPLLDEGRAPVEARLVAAAPDD